MAPEVDILLATYNGGEFVAAQLESLLQQSNSNWRLLIRDDGSTDDTRSICEEYVRRDPARIILLPDDHRHLGAVNSFGELLIRSAAPYVMFCDQDDVWLPEKISVELQAIKNHEATFGENLPLALFTDARVVDADLRPISASLLTYINRDGREAQTLERLCVEGTTYGCTMILNRALVDLVGTIPEGAISHDWWCGLAAAATGRLVYLDCTPIQHRRHRSNVSATKKNSWLRYLVNSTSVARHRAWMQRVLLQAETLSAAYSARCRSDARQLLEEIARARRSNGLLRRWILLRHGIHTTGLARNLAFFLAL